MGNGIETTRTTVADGVRVRKTIDTGPEEAGVVTLAVTLERDEPTTVRITEPALGSIPRDEIELHTDHGAEHWHVGDAATFEREFDAGESYEVVYRVADVDHDRFDDLDADPVVETVGSSVDDLVDRDDSDAVRELIAGDRESLAATAPAAGGVELSLESGPSEPADGPADDPAGAPAADPSTSPAAASSGGPAEESSPDEIPVESSSEEISVDVPSAEEPADSDPDSGLDSGEPMADEDDSAEPFPGPSDAEAPSDDLEASLAATPSGGLARILLKELREGHVDDETRAELRAELEPGRSQDVRIKHLQSQVSEFAAYVEMLDGFVDEHGTLDAVVGGMDDEVETLDEEVAAVRSELDGLSGSVDEDVGALETDVDDLRDDQGDLEARVDSLEDRLETVDDRLDEFDEFKEKLSGAFQGVGDAEP